MDILYHHRTQAQAAEGVHIRGIVKAFVALGHRVQIVSPPGVALPEETGITVTEAQRKIVTFNCSRFWKRVGDRAPQVIFELMEICYNLYSYFALRSAIRARRPHFIYDRYALFSIAPLLITRRYNIKLALEVNDGTVIQRSRPLFLKRLARRIERKVFCKAPVLITISEHFKQLLVKTYGIPPRRIAVVPNAIDPARFQLNGFHDYRREIGLDGKAVIGVVGAFVPWHGIDFLIESLQHLLKQHTGVKILLVGDGPVRSEIDSLANRLGLQDHVKFTGFVPACDVPKYISCMDICVMPESNEHGSPIKIFEYMAMGKPIVAPRYGPIEEIIQHGKTGILFTARNKTGLCDAARSLLNDEELRRRIGLQAKEYVFSHHTWTMNVQRVLSLMERCSAENAA